MPEVSFPSLRTIDSLGVAHVQGLEHLLQPLLRYRHRDDVNVVGHQAIEEAQCKVDGRATFGAPLLNAMLGVATSPRCVISCLLISVVVCRQK